MYIIIIGAGKLGYKLSELFSIKDNNVALVDVDEVCLAKANASIDILTVHANGLNVDILNQLDVKNADVLIAVTSEDETNMLLASIAKKAGCKKVIARIRKPEYTNQIEFLKSNLDINYVSNPDFEIAREIMKTINKREAANLEDFAKGRVALSQLKLDPHCKLLGKPLKELQLPSKLLIVAINRNQELIIPKGNTVLYGNDIVFIIGLKEETAHFSKQYGKPVEYKQIRSMMLLGGGNASFYLAKLLIKDGVSVKIIERNKERSKHLAHQLPHALVIHGDATDIKLLEEENLAGMDAVALLTGFDEENILLSLVAKKHGVSKVITKISKPNYTHLIQQLGIENIVNPVYVTASGIMRNIRGGRLNTISMLLGGQAEVFELIAGPDSPMLNKPLVDIDFPEGVIIGAIVKKSKVYIPNGQMEIQEGDRMVIFSVGEKSEQAEALFYKQPGLLERAKKGLFS
jgi:trk system potassium uptake protein TrkA